MGHSKIMAIKLMNALKDFKLMEYNYLITLGT